MTRVTRDTNVTSHAAAPLRSFASGWPSYTVPEAHIPRSPKHVPRAAAYADAFVGRPASTRRARRALLHARRWTVQCSRLGGMQTGDGVKCASSFLRAAVGCLALQATLVRTLTRSSADNEQLFHAVEQRLDTCPKKRQVAVAAWAPLASAVAAADVTGASGGAGP